MKLSPRKHVSDALKAKILEELKDPKVFVPSLAKKYGLRANRLYEWRNKYKKSADSVSVEE